MTTVDSSGNVASHNSIAIGSDGLPIVSYFDFTKRDLKVAHCTTLSCSSATLTAVDSVGMFGRDSSITIGSDGYPIVVYIDTNSILKVTHCLTLSCSSTTLNTIDNLNALSQPSIAIGTVGNPVISYYDYKDLKMFQCFSLNCSTGAVTILDSTVGLGTVTSIANASNGYPIVTYFLLEGIGKNITLKIAHCSTISCSSPTFTTFDGAPFGLYGYPSFATGSDGYPIISYYDKSNKDLKFFYSSSLKELLKREDSWILAVSMIVSHSPVILQIP